MSSISEVSSDGDVKIREDNAIPNKLDVVTSKQFNQLTFINLLLVFFPFGLMVFSAGA